MSACFPSGQFYKMVFLIGINGGGRTLVSVTAHFSFILQGGEIPEKRASFLLCTFLRDLLKAFSYYNLYSCVLSRFYLFFLLFFKFHQGCCLDIRYLHSKDIFQEKGLKMSPPP